MKRTPIPPRRPGWPVRCLLAIGSLLGSAGLAQPAFAADAPEPIEVDMPVELGWQAVEAMQRDRRDHRRVPRMLPLLSAPAPQGRLWLGLSKPRADAQAAARVQLELVWVVPIGR